MWIRRFCSTFEKLGIPLDEQKRLANVAIDVVFDSVSIGTTFQKKLQEAGVVLCSMSEAVHKYPELLEEYLGSVVPIGDNFFAALNSAVFSDGSFVYVPKGVRCPMELSTYFRINEKETGQFERTLIIAEEGSYVSYLEGCTAPAFDTNQLHAAVVELVAKERAEIKYSTVQNWYAGDPKTGKGGIYNFVTKRGVARAITRKSPGRRSRRARRSPGNIRAASCAETIRSGSSIRSRLTNGMMQADTGTKMIHVGKNTRSTIISKGISADSVAQQLPGTGQDRPARRKCAAITRSAIRCWSGTGARPIRSHPSKWEIQARKWSMKHPLPSMNEEQIFYLQSRGLSKDDAINLIVNGFCKEVIRELPLEFAAEAQKLLALKLENSVG